MEISKQIFSPLLTVFETSEKPLTGKLRERWFARAKRFYSCFLVEGKIALFFYPGQICAICWKMSGQVRVCWFTLALLFDEFYWYIQCLRVRVGVCVWERAGVNDERPGKHLSRLIIMGAEWIRITTIVLFFPIVHVNTSILRRTPDIAHVCNQNYIPIRIEFGYIISDST